MINSRNFYPENYYTNMKAIEKNLRKLNNLCQPLAPIPTESLFDKIAIKYQNMGQFFSDELEVKIINFSNINQTNAV